MKIARTILLVLVATATGIALIGCGGGDDEGASPSRTVAAASSPSPTKATTSSPESTQASQSDTIEVTVKEFSFTPDNFEVPQGKPVTVKVTDTGLSLHTLTVFKDAVFTDPVSGADVAVSPTQPAEFTVTFDEAGTLYFRCGIHPAQMQGEITVR